jgi:hypothetical protein
MFLSRAGGSFKERLISDNSPIGRRRLAPLFLKCLYSFGVTPTNLPEAAADPAADPSARGWG